MIYKLLESSNHLMPCRGLTLRLGDVSRNKVDQVPLHALRSLRFLSPGRFKHGIAFYYTKINMVSSSLRTECTETRWPCRGSSCHLTPDPFTSLFVPGMEIYSNLEEQRTLTSMDVCWKLHDGSKFY
jgi:hypothetical protein